MEKGGDGEIDEDVGDGDGEEHVKRIIVHGNAAGHVPTTKF